MSYIQIEIGGRLRGLKFNQGAIMWMQEKIDPENYNATSGYAIAWGGLKACCHVKGEELTKTVDDKEAPATFEDVCDWVDGLPNDVNAQITAALTESQVYKKRIDQLPDDVKKKLQELSTEQSVTELPVES